MHALTLYVPIRHNSHLYDKGAWKHTLVMLRARHGVGHLVIYCEINYVLLNCVKSQERGVTDEDCVEFPCKIWMTIVIHITSIDQTQKANPGPRLHFE